MTNPKKNRKIFNIVLAIVLAVGVWMYVINVENPSGTGTVREIPVTVVGEDSPLWQYIFHSCNRFLL